MPLHYNPHTRHYLAIIHSHHMSPILSQYLLKQPLLQQNTHLPLLSNVLVGLHWYWSSELCSQCILCAVSMQVYWYLSWNPRKAAWSGAVATQVCWCWLCVRGRLLAWSGPRGPRWRSLSVKISHTKVGSHDLEQACKQKWQTLSVTGSIVWRPAVLCRWMWQQQMYQLNQP